VAGDYTSRERWFGIERSVFWLLGWTFMERAMGIEPTSKAWEAYHITQKHAGLAAFLQFPERFNWKIMENEIGSRGQVISV
jgi:hypothetical protein